MMLNDISSYRLSHQEVHHILGRVLTVIKHQQVVVGLVMKILVLVVMIIKCMEQWVEEEEVVVVV